MRAVESGMRKRKRLCIQVLPSLKTGIINGCIVMLDFVTDCVS